MIVDGHRQTELFCRFYMGPRGHRKEYGIPDRDIAPEEPPKIHSALEWKYRRLPGWKDPKDYHKKFIYPM